MNLFLGGFFLLVSCKMSVAIILEYSYHQNDHFINWTSARSYCRDHYKDLATLNTYEDYKLIAEVENPKLSGWIGLYKDNEQSKTWKWSDEQPPAFIRWQTGWPSGGPNDCCVLFDKHLYNDPCDWDHPFYCYRYLILVNESKTWEEAHKFCTTNFTDLAALPFANQVTQAIQELSLSQTDSVWTGLRFMDGNWFWLNGEPIDKGDPNTTPLSLPECPAQPYYCGAFNTKTNAWENRDCHEKLNFLCSI